MPEKKSLLAWVDLGGVGNSWEGRAGGVALFRITWDDSKNHPGEPWVMSTQLPGFTGRRWRDGSAIALQEKADTFLAGWLARVQGEAR